MRDVMRARMAGGMGLFVLLVGIASAAYIPIPLTSVGNAHMQGRMPDAPIGNPVTLGGVDFDLTDGYLMSWV